MKNLELILFFPKKKKKYILLNHLNKVSFKQLKLELKNLRKSCLLHYTNSLKKEILRYEKESHRLEKKLEIAEKKESKTVLHLEEVFCDIQKKIRELKGLRKLIKEKKLEIKQKRLINNLKNEWFYNMLEDLAKDKKIKIKKIKQKIFNLKLKNDALEDKIHDCYFDFLDFEDEASQKKSLNEVFNLQSRCVDNDKKISHLKELIRIEKNN